MTIDVRERLRTKEGQGTRLISVFPIDNADGTLDLIYMFQHGTEVAQYRYTINEHEELESLADLYKGALNMEREVVDLFGLRFKGVEGGLLLCPESGVVAPMRKPGKKQEQSPEEGKDA